MVATFLLLTFALTWTAWAPALHRAGPAAPPIAPALALGGPVFLLGVFAPGLVALALTARTEGRAGVAALLGRIGRWRVGARYYACALLLMPVTKLAVAALVRGLTGAWPAFGETRPVVLLGATLLGTLGQAGEEVGWRGYLLPRLAGRVGLAGASLLVGAVWAVWHVPLFYAPGADTYRQSFPLYALQLTAYAVALAWLYWRTGGSLLLPMLMHAAFNNMKDIVPSGIPPGLAPPGLGPFTLEGTLVFRLTVGLLWLVGAALLVRMRGARLAGGPGRPQRAPAP